MAGKGNLNALVLLPFHSELCYYTGVKCKYYKAYKINMKKFLSLLAVLVLALSAVHLSAAEEAPEMTFSNLTTENEYLGTASDAPLTEAEIAGEDTQILKDGDIIHTVIHPVLPLPVTNETEALEAACRLMPLMGAEADAELGLHAVLKARNQKIYAFTQIRNDEPVPARNLKLAAGPDGALSAVFSSLAYPAETPESLGETEDGLGPPVMLLRNLELLTGEDMNNAAYTGILGDWQTTTGAASAILKCRFRAGAFLPGKRRSPG